MKMKDDPGYYVDFEFEYPLPETSSIVVKFSVHIGHTLDQAYESYGFIWRHNLNSPGMNKIELRYIPDEDPDLTPLPLILSRRTPEGVGDF